MEKSGDDTFRVEGFVNLATGRMFDVETGDPKVVEDIQKDNGAARILTAVQLREERPSPLVDGQTADDLKLAIGSIYDNERVGELEEKSYDLIARLAVAVDSLYKMAWSLNLAVPYKTDLLHPLTNYVGLIEALREKHVDRIEGFGDAQAWSDEVCDAAIMRSFFEMFRRELGRLMQRVVLGGVSGLIYLTHDQAGASDDFGVTETLEVMDDYYKWIKVSAKLSNGLFKEDDQWLPLQAHLKNLDVSRQSDVVEGADQTDVFALVLSKKPALEKLNTIKFNCLTEYGYTHGQAEELIKVCLQRLFGAEKHLFHSTRLMEGYRQIVSPEDARKFLDRDVVNRLHHDFLLVLEDIDQKVQARPRMHFETLMFYAEERLDTVIKSVVDEPDLSWWGF